MYNLATTEMMIIKSIKSAPRIMLRSRLAGGPSSEDVAEDFESLSRF
jgi:hypothetical protein